METDMSLLINTASAAPQPLEITSNGAPVTKPRGKQNDALDALAQALMAGDLAAANRAYADAQNAVATKRVDDPGPSFAAIGTALQAGDLETAKRALPRPPVVHPSFSLDGVDPLEFSTGNPSTPPRRAAPLASRDEAVSGYASALSTAIKEGDPEAIKMAMAEAMDFLTTSGTVPEAALASPVGAPQTFENPSNNPIMALLNDPNFNSLQIAVNSENTADIKSAWAQFINGGTGTTSSAPLLQNDPTSDLGVTEVFPLMARNDPASDLGHIIASPLAAQSATPLLSSVAPMAGPAVNGYSRVLFAANAGGQEKTLVAMLRSLAPDGEQAASAVRAATATSQSIQLSNETQRASREASAATRTGYSGLTNREIEAAQDRFRPNSLSMANHTGGEGAFSHFGQSGSSSMSEERSGSHYPGRKSTMAPAEFKTVLEALDVLLAPV